MICSFHFHLQWIKFHTRVTRFGRFGQLFPKCNFWKIVKVIHKFKLFFTEKVMYWFCEKIGLLCGRFFSQIHLVTLLHTYALIDYFLRLPDPCTWRPCLRSKCLAPWPPESRDETSFLGHISENKILWHLKCISLYILLTTTHIYWRDLIPRPIAHVSSVAGGVRTHCQGRNLCMYLELIEVVDERR
jgi:hypothetical protein